MSASDIIITVENLSKRYKLGTIGATTLRDSVERAWHRLRGRDWQEHMGKIGHAAKPLPIKTADRRPLTGLSSVALAKEEDLLGGSASGGAGDHHEIGRIEDPKSLQSAVCSLQSSSSPTDDLWALKDVSFEVKRGEVLGVIGRNGAGKSTLLKILTRITEPTSGRAIMRGRVASLLEVGTGFHPELTGRENIYLNGAILGMKRAEITRKFDEIVAFAEVEKFIDTPVKRYSSGMYVRLAFAVAAHLDPEILLVDEVLAVGDITFQTKCLGKMSDVAKTGRTILFVSHNMGAISRLCHRSMLLSNGGLALIGSNDVVVSQYMSNQEHGSAQLCWSSEQAPGDESIRLRSASVCQPAGIVSASVKMTEPFFIELEYDILKQLPEVTFALVMSRADGTVALHSGSISVGHAIAALPGRKKCVCEVPANLLMHGLYFAQISADIPNVKILFLSEKRLAWSVEMTCGIIGRYNPSAWTGVINPRAVNWSVQECQDYQTQSTNYV